MFRKELRLLGDDESLVDANFRDEDRILKILRGLKNPNIVPILTSYRYRGYYSFLFPRAEGDLSSFLSSSKRPPSFEHNVSIIRALHGLASGLSDLHVFVLKSLNMEFKGCHHDLKPQNILISQGRFLLADFGLSRLKPTGQDSTSISKSIGDYLAPECRADDDQRQYVGRKSDIWSFGCIIAEVLAFMDDGREGCERLKNSRVTFIDGWKSYSFHSAGMLKQSIRQWLVAKSDTESCGNLAWLYQLTFRMLQPEPAKRPSASIVQQVLRCIEAKVLFDESLRLFDHLAEDQNDGDLGIERQKLFAWGFTSGVFQQEPWQLPLCRPDVLSEACMIILRSMFDRLQSLQSHNDWHMSSKDVEFHPERFPEDMLGPQTRHTDRSLKAANAQLIELLGGTDQRMWSRFLLRIVLYNDNASARSSDPSRSLQSWNQEEVTNFGAMKDIKIILDLAKSKLLDGSLKHMIPRDAQVTAVKPLEHHAQGKHTAADGSLQDVFIEWQPIWASMRKLSEEQLRRVDALAKISTIRSRPEEVRVLDCKGYFVDLSRRAYGVLYCFPNVKQQKSIATLETFSLFSLLDSTMSERAVHKRPFLGQRFAIARSIAACILYFHSIDWLHERLSSHNIMFFKPTDISISEYNTLPYVVGLTHSREDNEKAWSNGPDEDATLYQDYSHPQYHVLQRFHRVFDYYSVGMVLLEIGLWRTLNSIVSIYPTYDREGLRNEIIERHLPELRYHMGETYHDVVLDCLTETIGTSETPDFDLTTNFQSLVVEKLERCKV